MASQRLMQRFARWHIWLGWAVGLPLLMWTVTGLWMVARPIEEVRGTNLRTDPAAINPAGLQFPTTIGKPFREARLISQPGGPAWIITSSDGSRLRYSAKLGTVTPPVMKEEAQQIARAAYKGPTEVDKVTYFPSGKAPLDSRSEGPVWQTRFADGARVYVDATTGEVQSVRTDQWRLYDFMWGLHIMDPVTREDTHNPFVIVFSIAAIAGTLLGCILLFRRRKARVRVAVPRGTG
jgi:uncharacterized iron-regulated membrane protein